MAPILSEPAARWVSPVMLLVALVCFALPFAAVSCNPDSAKPAIDQAVRTLARSTTAGELDALNRCLDGLKGRSVATYSGLNLAVGSDPTTGPMAASACPRAVEAEASFSGKEANLGAQSLAAGALAAVALALVFSLLRFRSRGLVAALLSGVAVVMLVLDQNRIPALATARVAEAVRSHVGAGNTVGIALGNVVGVTVDAGIGFWLVTGLLLVAALYSSAATIISGSRPWHPPPPAPAQPPLEAG